MTETMLFIFSFSFIFYLSGNAIVTMSCRLMYSAFVAFTFCRSLLAVAPIRADVPAESPHLPVALARTTLIYR